MDAKFLRGTAHEFVQGFAIGADGWYFETDEDATRHDRALEKAVEQRDLALLTELINTAPVRGSNAVLVPADKLKELQDERDRLKDRDRESRALLQTASTFLLCDPDAVDTALVAAHGMMSQEDTRGLLALIHDHLLPETSRSGRNRPKPAKTGQGLPDRENPIFCEHPNEVPQACPCAPDCYCKDHTCRYRGAS